MPGTWDVVIPLKPTARGKSRLGLQAEQRQALALAFLLDVLDAVTPAEQVAAVTVVCGVSDAHRLPPGVRIRSDDSSGLNDVLAAATAPEHLESPFALIMMSDLPCTTTASIDMLIAAMEPVIVAGGPATQAFLSDQPGVGTTALGGRAGALQPRFGKRSRAAHRFDGAVEITDPVFARLRRDVDSLPELVDAVRLGVGAHTQRVWAELDLAKSVSATG